MINPRFPCISAGMPETPLVTLLTYWPRATFALSHFWTENRIPPRIKSGACFCPCLSIQPLEHDRCIGAAEAERIRQDAAERHAVAPFPHDRHVGESRIERGDIGALADEAVAH